MSKGAKIYVMKADDGRLKLGISVNPEARAKQIGVPVSIIHQTDVIEHARQIEKLAHRVLALHGTHLRGEWFEATLQDAIRAIEVATRQAENQELALGGTLKGGNSDPEGSTRPQINIRVGDDVLAAIDDIRSMMRPIPTVADVIRMSILNYRDALKRKIEAQERRG